DRPTFHLVAARARVDDLATDVAHDPDLLHPHVTRLRIHGSLHDLRKVTRMAEVRADAHAGALGQLLAPARLLADGLQHPSHAGVVEADLLTERSLVHDGRFRRTQKV